MDTLFAIWFAIAKFFSSPEFAVVSGLGFVITILLVVYLYVCALLNLTPVVFRFAVALWMRRIAIVGSVESFNSLRDTITDSGLFKTKRVHHVTSDKLEKLRGETIILVDWGSAQTTIGEVFNKRKSHNTAVVIIARMGEIDKPVFDDISNRPNTVIVNSRGRLLNDLLTSLMTTSYDNG